MCPAGLLAMDVQFGHEIVCITDQGSRRTTARASETRARRKHIRGAAYENEELARLGPGRVARPAPALATHVNGNAENDLRDV